MTNYDWITSAVRGSIPVIVVGVLLACRKWLPSHAVQAGVNWDSDALYQRFRPLSWRINVTLLVVMVSFALSTGFLLSHTNKWLAVLNGPRAIHLLPETAIWWFFPGFGALACSYEITLQIFSRFLGNKTIDLYNDWANNNTRGWVRSRYQGIDTRRVLRWMMGGIALPIGLFVLLALPMHANVGSETIQDCGYAFKPCTVYSLSRVSRITEIAGFRDRSGRLLNRAGLILDFKDGRRWSSATWGDWSNHVDPALENALLQRTGLPIGYALTEEEIPPLGSQPPQ